MKKYSWIVALLIALTFTTLFVSCGADFDASKLEAEPWVVDDGDIKLEVIGGTKGDSEAEGNVLTTIVGPPASSVGFAWKFPTSPGPSGINYDDYEKVRVTITGIKVKRPSGGVSYNAKINRGMGADVNRFGETGSYQNATMALASNDFVGYADYPVKGFPEGEIAFQYNCWEGNDEIDGPGDKTNPSHTIKVNFTFFSGDSPDGEFIPVTAINGIPTSGFAGTPLRLLGQIEGTNAKGDKVDPTSEEKIVWQIINGSGATANTANVEWDKSEIMDDSYDPAEATGEFTDSKDTILAANIGWVTVRATIKDGAKNAEGAIVDYTEEFDISFSGIGPAKTGTIGALTGEGGTATAITGGFSYTTTDLNYQGNYACFEFTLATGDTFDQVGKVSFDFERKDGDYTWKNLDLWASDAVITGGMWSGAPSVAATNPQYKGTDTPVKESMEIFVDASKTEDLAENVVFLVVHANGGGNAAAEYELTNISYYLLSEAPDRP